MSAEPWNKDLPPADLPELISENLEGSKVIPFQALVQIDTSNLRREFEIQAAWSHYFGTQYGLAKVRTEKAARELKQGEAEKFLEYKAAARETKATVDQIKSQVESDPHVKTLYNNFIECRKRESMWESAKWSWNERGNMLTQIGADERFEKKAFG